MFELPLWTWFHAKVSILLKILLCRGTASKSCWHGGRLILLNPHLYILVLTCIIFAPFPPCVHTTEEFSCPKSQSCWFYFSFRTQRHLERWCSHPFGFWLGFISRDLTTYGECKALLTFTFSKWPCSCIVFSTTYHPAANRESSSCVWVFL